MKENEKHKKVCWTLNYFENFLVFVSAIIGCVSVSAFASLVGVSVDMASFAVGLKFCTPISEIEEYKSIIKVKCC